MINKKSTIKKLIVIGALALLLGVLMLLKMSKSVCEFFATTFSRVWIFIFGNLFGVFPFSLYELLLVVVIIGIIIIIVCFIKYLCGRKWQRLLSMCLSLVIAVLAFVNIYTLSASFSYNRADLPSEIYVEYTSEDFTKEDAIQLASIMVDKVNAAFRKTEHDANGNIVYPYTNREMSDLLDVEYSKLQNRYFSPYTPRAKTIINKTIMSEMHIVGVFFAPFGEANINGYETSLDLPHTMAHELAHGKGVMREHEANLVAYYILVTCDNEYLSYGSLVDCMYSALSLLSMFPDSQKDYNEIVAKIDKGINVERRNYSKFWSQFTTLDKIGRFFNDLYLKMQNQGGTVSYSKTPIIVDTGKVDGDNQPIFQILRFSNIQNMLIKLYKENRL